jgi:hypothetical protein
MLILSSTNKDKIISNHCSWVRVLGQRKQTIERLNHFWLWLMLTQWLCWYIMDCITLWWPRADLNNNWISYLVHQWTLRWNYQFFSWVMQKMYSLTVLTFWNRVVLEKLIVYQLVNTFPIFYGTQSFICFLQELTSGLYLEPDESSPTFLSYFLNISVNIILPLCLVFLSSIGCSHQKSVCIFLIMRVIWPTHLILLG